MQARAVIASLSIFIKKAKVVLMNIFNFLLLAFLLVF